MPTQLGWNAGAWSQPWRRARRDHTPDYEDNMPFYGRSRQWLAVMAGRKGDGKQQRKPKRPVKEEVGCRPAALTVLLQKVYPRAQINSWCACSSTARPRRTTGASCCSPSQLQAVPAAPVAAPAPRRVEPMLGGVRNQLRWVEMKKVSCASQVVWG